MVIIEIQDGKGILPLIMFKRNTIEKNRNLGNKLDGNLASLVFNYLKRDILKETYMIILVC
jgi:hypothetical protein